MLISWPHPTLAKVILLTRGEKTKLTWVDVVILLHKQRTGIQSDCMGALLIPLEEVILELTSGKWEWVSHMKIWEEYSQEKGASGAKAWDRKKLHVLEQQKDIHCGSRVIRPGEGSYQIVTNVMVSLKIRKAWDIILQLGTLLILLSIY